jgi:plasmid stability protein
MEPYIRYGADMPNISVKDVPEAWAEALRQRAARNHRSLQGELMAIIEQAAQESLLSAAATQTAGRRPGAAATRRGSKTIEQIYAEHLVRFPEPITQGPLSVDIIREDRDSR